MINNDQSTLLLYCCEDVKLHRSGGDTVPLNYDPLLTITCTFLYNNLGLTVFIRICCTYSSIFISYMAANFIYLICIS